MDCAIREGVTPKYFAICGNAVRCAPIRREVSSDRILKEQTTY
jgi:hypothetical protein